MAYVSKYMVFVDGVANYVRLVHKPVKGSHRTGTDTDYLVHWEGKDRRVHAGPYGLYMKIAGKNIGIKVNPNYKPK